MRSSRDVVSSHLYREHLWGYLADVGRGIEIHEEWLWGVPREQVVGALRPLVALPVELVLPAHGAPTDRAALERALS